MKYVVTAHDGNNQFAERARVRPRHLENLAGLGSRVMFAGGILNEDGKPIGSVLVLDLESEDQLKAYLASEPYIQEKVWEDVVTEPFNLVFEHGEKVGK